VSGRPEHIRHKANFNYRVRLSENGWTSDFLACERLLEAFTKPARERELNTLEPILLVLDDHRPHVTNRLVNLAAAHNIQILQLPFHT
jgi:hypothetical protein